MEPNYYIQAGNGTSATQVVSITGNGYWDSGLVSGGITVKSGINPVLAFKFIKKKFGMLEGVVLERRLKKLESACYQAIENGQEALGEKFIRELARETRESVIYAKGIRHFVEREDVMKVKFKIKDGHISDTKFKDFTKVIPKDVLAKKKAVEGIFDDFVIYHYYNNKVEEKIAKKQKMSSEEKEKMKDPILFGIIKETDRLYFIADWEDEYCDLTFDEIVDVVGENKLSKYPELKVS